MAKLSIPPVKLPWREKDIQSGDHKLLADYLKVLVKTLQKKLEEVGNIININADKMGDMLKDDYDPDNDKKVEQADYADNAGHAANADHANNADNATNANHATTADSATNADHANNADNATNANHATTADSATNADKLDNEDSSFYRNASNLNAGIVPRARLDGTYDIDITGDAQTLQGKSPSDFASSTHTHTLGDLSNVTISSPTNGQVLGYQDGTWKNINGGGGTYYVCPEDYGAVGNGVDNDVNAFNQMISYINSLSSPVIIILSKPYYIGGSLNTIYFNKPICFRGCGIDVANLIFASGLNGIRLEKKTDNDSPAPCTIEDFTISTRGKNTGTAFFAHQAKPWNKTKFIAKNVVFAGDNDPGQDGWSKGLYLKDIGDVRIYGCYFYNYYNNQAKGIHLEGTASGNYVPTKINITDCNFLYGSKGIFANGHVEGVIVKGCHFVAPDYGFYFTWTSSFIPPHFSFENNHFDIYNTAICLATPVADFYATFNNITGRGEAEPGGRSQNQDNYVRTGIYLSSGTIRARIDNNYFLNGGVSSADISFNAIILANGATNNFIGGNTYDNGDHDMLAVWEQYPPDADTGNKIMYNINDNFNVYIGSVNPYLKSQP